MFGKLLFLFIVIPLADLFLLMLLSSYTGWQFSVAMVILSGIVGAFLAKLSYKSVINKIGQRVASGQMSADLLSDGAMIFFAAGLLLTPGFITDAVGFALLIPVCRTWLKGLILKWFKKHFKFEVLTPTRSSENDDGVIDGEVLHKQTNVYSPPVIEPDSDT